MPTRAQSRPFQRFFHTEAAGGLILVVSAAAALIVANSAWADGYQRLWSTRVTIGLMDGVPALTVHQWINDGLMTVFFLLMGLEIKRELVAGELSSPRQAALPIAGALGGMALPALIYLIINRGGLEARGWAIPMATDIAFALGTLNLIASSIPLGAKLFLTALAIVDDMGAVLVIALFYTQHIDSASLLFASVTIALLVVLNVSSIERLAPYLVLGVALWLFVHASGVHSTIAGVLLAFTIPMRAGFDRPAPLVRLENALHGFSAFVVMPLFAFSNAGVTLGGVTSSMAVTLGAALGLAIGKPLGITGLSFAAVKAGLASLPRGVSRIDLHGCSWVGGIGFTMSLFVANLAFEGTPLLDAAKLGIIGGSVVSVLVATVIFRVADTAGIPPG